MKFRMINCQNIIHSILEQETIDIVILKEYSTVKLNARFSGTPFPDIMYNGYLKV